MREFIKESWKTASAFAAGAFLLSLLIGLTAGNPFGVVIFRAILLGLFFAALGAGFRWAVRTWLAEPAAPAAGGAGASSAAAQDGRGSRVDITLGEEAGAGPGSVRATAEEAGLAEPMDEETSSSADDTAARAEAAALGELSQELAGDPAPADEEAAGVEEMDGEAPMDLPGPRGKRDKPGSLDSLPDISLQDEPPARPVSRARRSRPETPGEALRDAVRDSVARQDPATLARALRTVVKKDEKG